MNYDTVIVEMLSRIQALEEQVAELKKMLENNTDPDNVEVMEQNLAAVENASPLTDEELTKIQVEAISNLKIDKITVWDNGAGKDGKTSTANFLSGMMQAVPPMQELFDMAGMKLPEYLGKQNVEAEPDKDAE